MRKIVINLNGLYDFIINEIWKTYILWDNKLIIYLRSIYITN